MRLALFFLTYFISIQVRAEYRAYVLKITDTATGQSRLVNSTLDDVQYTGYFTLRKTELIQIEDTWMCWGRQGEFKKPCPSPRAPAAAQPSAAP